MMVLGCCLHNVVYSNMSKCCKIHNVSAVGNEEERFDFSQVGFLLRLELIGFTEDYNRYYQEFEITLPHDRCYYKFLEVDLDNNVNYSLSKSKSINFQRKLFLLVEHTSSFMSQPAIDVMGFLQLIMHEARLWLHGILSSIYFFDLQN